MTEAYINEVMDLERYRTEMERLRVRREQLEGVLVEIERRGQMERDSRKAAENLKGFCGRVTRGLASMPFEEKQELLRLVVEQTTIEGGRVTVETIIPVDNDPVQLRTRHPEFIEA